MTDYRPRFKSCGKDVVIEDNVYIEHPELIDVGDRVRFCRGFYMIEGPQICKIGSDVTFWPNSFLQGRGARFIVDDHVDFYPTTYISFGDNGIIEIAHHTHFAPGCAMYGHGHLKIGPYCNIAAHCVFATVGHDPIIRDKPMTYSPACSGPITLVEDIWLGANVTITANVHIARGCIVGANAVLTRSTEEYGLYIGVPARRLRDRKKEN